jgi:hypothetical protein
LLRCPYGRICARQRLPTPPFPGDSEDGFGFSVAINASAKNSAFIQDQPASVTVPCRWVASDTEVPLLYEVPLLLVEQGA